MNISWKYFIGRILTGALVLFIVVLLLSSVFTAKTYSEKKTDIRRWVLQDCAENDDELANMTFEERQEWIEDRRLNYTTKDDVDEPLIQKSLSKSFAILQGDMGTANILTSREGSQEVSDIILEVLPNTALLYATAALIYITLGIFMGTKAAQVEGTKLDTLISGLNIFTSSMPMWWVAMIGVLVFGLYLGIVPPSSRPFPRVSGIPYYLGVIHRMLLPLGTIVLTQFGARAWSTRRLVLDEMRSNHIEFARAKGLKEKIVVRKHALKSAAPAMVSSSIITLLNAFPFMILTELITGWPGIGMLYYKSIVVNEDPPVLIGLVFITALIYIIGYIIADIMNGYLDPRIKVGNS